MKTVRIIFISLAVLLQAFSMQAEGRLRERVYVSTDRDVYVAGDRVWLSAYCVDPASGRLSSFSKTAYLELHSADAMVQTARVALSGGRGAGVFTLPSTLPTGNYRLLAYTALESSEKGFDAGAGSRIISVFNILSTARAEGGVIVQDDVPAAAVHPQAGSLAVSVGRSADGHTPLTVTNGGAQPVLFNLSVRHADAIAAPQSEDMVGFASALSSLPAPSGFDKSVAAEYEGEIIRASVTGASAEGVRALNGKNAFLSSPGDGSGVYSSAIHDGRVTFFTSNIYGKQEMFLEIEGVGRDNICHLELDSPFLDLPAGEIPALALCPSYAPDLALRGLGMQLEQAFDADTLYSPLPDSRPVVFDRNRCKSYVLDDYTRFPVMEELFTEFIPEVRVRTVEGSKQLQVRTIDLIGNNYFAAGSALVLLDGVPVLDQRKILGYDPLLVRRIDVYSGLYFLGIRSFRGVVNFVTYKGTLEGMQFEDNVRIVTFEGCPLPLAYTCEDVGKDYPDWRQTLYWHPLLKLAPGESVGIDCKSPLYEGDFEVMAEGLTDSGEPVRTTTSFRISR